MTSKPVDQPLLTSVPAEISTPPNSETDDQPLLTSVPAEEISTPPNSKTRDQPLLSGEMAASGDETVPSTATNILGLVVTLALTEEEVSEVCESESLPPNSDSDYFPTPEKRQ